MPAPPWTWSLLSGLTPHEADRGVIPPPRSNSVTSIHPWTRPPGVFDRRHDYSGCLDRRWSRQHPRKGVISCRTIRCLFTVARRRLEVVERTRILVEKVLTDPLNWTVALADGAGTSKTKYTYEPFGETTVTGTRTGLLRPCFPNAADLMGGREDVLAYLLLFPRTRRGLHVQRGRAAHLEIKSRTGVSLVLPTASR